MLVHHALEAFVALFFTGLKHSGKTTAAKRVASALKRCWVDSDDLMLERLGGMSVRSFYREKGKDEFMRLENEVVEAFLEREPECVMSLGGGAADNARLMETLKRSGRIVYLSRPEGTLLSKVLEKSGIPPFLDGNDVSGSWHVLYERRDRIYSNYADMRIELGDYQDKDETMRTIIKQLESEGII